MTPFLQEESKSVPYNQEGVCYVCFHCSFQGSWPHFCSVKDLPWLSSERNSVFDTALFKDVISIYAEEDRDLLWIACHLGPTICVQLRFFESTLQVRILGAFYGSQAHAFTHFKQYCIRWIPQSKEFFYSVMDDPGEEHLMSVTPLNKDVITLVRDYLNGDFCRRESAGDVLRGIRFLRDDPSQIYCLMCVNRTSDATFSLDLMHLPSGGRIDLKTIRTKIDFSLFPARMQVMHDPTSNRNFCFFIGSHSLLHSITIDKAAFEEKDRRDIVLREGVTTMGLSVCNQYAWVLLFTKVQAQDKPRLGFQVFKCANKFNALTDFLDLNLDFNPNGFPTACAVHPIRIDANENKWMTFIVHGGKLYQREVILPDL